MKDGGNVRKYNCSPVTAFIVGTGEKHKEQDEEE